MGREETVNLVVVLRQSLTLREYNEFDKQALTVPDARHPGSYSNLPEIQAVMKAQTEGRYFVLINYFESTTPTERAAVEKRLQESPFVDCLVRDSTLEKAIGYCEG